MQTWEASKFYQIYKHGKNHKKLDKIIEIKYNNNFKKKN